jgi:hypothetical protein
MEILVEEEVERQIKTLPPRTSTYINRLELVAYALNQLPSLYATSERGLEYQLQRGRAKFKDQIKQAVLRALAAIRRDPIRTYAPLQPPQQSAPLKEVLHQLRVVLKNDKVDWENLPKAVELALQDSQPDGVTWDARYGVAPHPSGYASRRAPLPSRQAFHHMGLDVSTVDSPPTTPSRPDPTAIPTGPHTTSMPPRPQTAAMPTGPQTVAPKPSAKPNERAAATRSDVSRRVASRSERSLPEYGWDDPFYTI